MKKFLIASIIFIETAVAAQVPDYNPNRDPIQKFDKVNEGQKPKVTIIQRDGDSKDNPLYILDGEEISREEFSKINPGNIESVHVLKDKSAEAIYGEKGKYGVIIINSKRKAETDTITISR